MMRYESTFFPKRFYMKRQQDNIINATQLYFQQMKIRKPNNKNLFQNRQVLMLLSRIISKYCKNASVENRYKRIITCVTIIGRNVTGMCLQIVLSQKYIEIGIQNILSFFLYDKKICFSLYYIRTQICKKFKDNLRR